jgi:hypothetical protein
MGLIKLAYAKDLQEGAKIVKVCFGAGATESERERERSAKLAMARNLFARASSRAPL